MIKPIAIATSALALLLAASGPTMPPGPWDEKPALTEIEIPGCYPCDR